MTEIQMTYSKKELAWLSQQITIDRDIYLTIALKKPGKVVIRQKDDRGEFPRVPIRRHTDTRNFSFRMQVALLPSTIQLFTSTEPKEIKYAYISTRRKVGDESSASEYR